MFNAFKVKLTHEDCRDGDLDQFSHPSQCPLAKKISEALGHSASISTSIGHIHKEDDFEVYASFRIQPPFHFIDFEKLRDNNIKEMEFSITFNA